MTAFVLAAIALTAATLFPLLRSLKRPARPRASSADALNAAVYRDQLAELDAAAAQGALSCADHAAAREAIRRRLAEDLQPAAPAVSASGSGRAAWLGLALALPLAAGALYAALGDPRALAPRPASAAADAGHGLQSPQIAAMVERLAARLANQPEDLDGWIMLGRSYSALGRFAEAARAYGEGAKRAPRDAQLLADYADVLAMAQGRRFDGEPDRIVAAALEADPANIKALALAGSSAFARKDYAPAVAFWARIRELAPPESNMARSVEASIAQARALMGEPAAAAFVAGTVRLAPALAARVKPGDTLFIYARATDSRVPVAILRKRAGELPVAFRLDDSSAMSPAARISSLREVVVTARISATGSATPQPGDLEAASGPVRVGASAIALEIADAVR
jgi:cytochrome c-type biogenesis protein CcmH